MQEDKGCWDLKSENLGSDSYWGWGMVKASWKRIRRSITFASLFEYISVYCIMIFFPLATRQLCSWKGCLVARRIGLLRVKELQDNFNRQFFNKIKVILKTNFSPKSYFFPKKSRYSQCLNIFPWTLEDLTQKKVIKIHKKMKNIKKISDV